MSDHTYHPGRLPCEIIQMKPSNTIMLPAELMLALRIEPQSHVQQMLGGDQTVVITKYTGSASPSTQKNSESAPVVLVNRQRKLHIAARFCREYDLNEDDTLALYLDKIHQRIIVKKYDVIQDTLTQIHDIARVLSSAIGDLVVPSAECYAALQSLRSAENQLKVAQAAKSKQTSRRAV